jgi:membrane protein YdbS with pleckstrin-like domain
VVRTNRDGNLSRFNALKQYSLCALLIIALLYVVATVFLGPNREGIGLALLVAYPVQLFAFFLLMQTKKPGANFLVWWGAGMGLRFTVVLAVALIAKQMDFPAIEPLLLSLVGSFFLLVLAESRFLNSHDRIGATG